MPRVNYNSFVVTFDIRVLRFIFYYYFLKCSLMVLLVKKKNRTIANC